MNRSRFVVAMLSLVGLVGCGGAESTARSGITECGPVEKCQAGQYCDDPRFARCAVGCLSDSNCASNQTCAITSGSVGTCMNTSASNPNPNPNPNPTPTKGCGDQTCTDAELSTCATDCQPVLDGAFDICKSYDFFGCFGPGALQSCYDRVERASVAQLEQWVHCGSTSTVDCTPCDRYLP